MRLLFLLAGDGPKLARQEILSLVKGKLVDESDRVLVIETKSLIKRLALTRKIYRFLFECRIQEIQGKLSSYNWNKVYKKSFSLRLVNLSSKKFDEARLAGLVYQGLKNPRVDLKAAETQIEIIVTKDKAFCGILLWENKEDFQARRAHLRPGFMPISLHPRLARAMVNLTGSKTSVLDPFCGTGGFLIEAGLMGLKAEGSDLDSKALELCRLNLEHFRIRNYRLGKRDATRLPKTDYVVTDLPCGRSARIFHEGLESLCKDFLNALGRSLGKRAVIALPKGDYKALARKAGLKLAFQHDVYIHKSLTKRILVLER